LSTRTPGDRRLGEKILRRRSTLSLKRAFPWDHAARHLRVPCPLRFYDRTDGTATVDPPTPMPLPYSSYHDMSTFPRDHWLTPPLVQTNDIHATSSPSYPIRVLRIPNSRVWRGAYSRPPFCFPRSFQKASGSPITLSFLLVPELTRCPVPSHTLVPFTRRQFQWFGEYRRHPPPWGLHCGAESLSRMWCIQMRLDAIRDVRTLVGLWVISDWPDEAVDSHSFTPLTRCTPLNTVLVNANCPIGSWFHSYVTVFFGSSHLWEPFSGIQFRLRVENFTTREAPPPHSYSRLSILHPTAATPFPSHRPRGSSTQGRANACRHNCSFYPFVANLLDPIHNFTSLRRTV